MAYVPRVPVMPEICGFARASMDRMQKLRTVAAEVVITACVVPGGMRLTLRVRESMSAVAGDCFPVDVNVHHAKHVGSGYPFLASSFGVRLGAPGSTVEVVLESAEARPGEVAIVLQDADAFQGRMVRLAG